MHPLPRIFPAILVVAAALLLTACQTPLFSLLPVLPEEDQFTLEGAVSSDSDESQDSPDNESNIAASNEQSDTTSDATLAVTDASDTATATIVVSSLRLRSGPGVEYDILGAALAGETLDITGQAFNCAWLNGIHPTLGNVWFSGAAQYTSMNIGCDSVPTADVPAAPTQPAPVEAAAKATPTQPQQSVAPTETPVAGELEPPESPVPAAPEQQSSEEGCYLIRGYAGPALTVAVTAIDRDWSTTVNFAGDSSRPLCFTPGRYTITIVAPSIWKGMGTGFDVQPGVHQLSPADLLQ